MRVVDLIIKKRNGFALTKEEIDFIISGYVDGSIPDYQISALMMAIYFNPLNDEWMDYIRKNKRTVKKLSEHHNQLFAGKFGFFSLSKIPYLNDLDNFIKERVIQGINALQTHLSENDYFNNPQIVKPLIEEFGLLETGGTDMEK